LALCWSRLSSMAPQEHEVGRTFYGSVPMPVEQKVVEGSSKVKTLKIVALGAVVLTAAVFAFTSPVSTGSVNSAVDVDLPHYELQTCFCDSNCVNQPGYNFEGVCQVDSASCIDFLGREAALCDATQQALLGNAATDYCGQCDMVVGENSCWSNPCTNGGLCADRTKVLSTGLLSGTDAENPEVLGYVCHCPWGYEGVNCQTPTEFCFDKYAPFASSKMFCSNGEVNTECVTDDDCAFVKEAASDTASTCSDEGLQVCDEFADCSQATAENGARSYECKCNEGFEGDGYQSKQDMVAYKSIVTSQCAAGVAAAIGGLVSNDASIINTAGWLARDCDADTGVYGMAGCRNIDGCTKNTGGTSFCQNSATCTDTYATTAEPGSYDCTCPTDSRNGVATPLWFGKNCEDDIDECTVEEGAQSGICGSLRRAVCTNLNPADDTDEERGANGFDCTCTTGWVTLGWEDGVFQGCEDESDCASNPCKNGATCAESAPGDSKFICTCAHGWQGDTCEEDIDECLAGEAGDASCAMNDNQECVNTNAINADTGSVAGNSQGWFCKCSEHWTWRDAVVVPAIPAETNICVDYDDCIDIPCKNGATCNNQGQSVAYDWKCICAPGWEGPNCDEDINECEYVHTTGGLGCDETGKNCQMDPASETDRMHDCLAEAQCINIDGSWECKCYDGYYGNGVDFCADVDDCKRHSKIDYFCQSDMQECDPDSFDCGGKCIYTDADGFVTNTITRCTDAAGCAADASLQIRFAGSVDADYTCDASFNVCTNDESLTTDAYPKTITYDTTDALTTGVVSEAVVYDDLSIFVTPAAWVLDKVVFDENGDDNVHQCGYMTEESPRSIWTPTGVCVDTGVNAFRCDCQDGWTDSNCDVDVAECQLNIDNCDRNADCVDTPGSFQCTCKYGYEDANKACDVTTAEYEAFTQIQKAQCGLQCSDIDDCTGGEAKCIHGECRDIGAMAYRCKCTPGYTDFKCDADINECGQMTDNCDREHGICKNTFGSWECECMDGYFGTGEVGDCEEVNDCALNPCEHGSCSDIGKSYACTCDAGWDDKHCDHDKNECIMTQSSADHNCDVAGRCVNTPGSFYCRCVSGFQGDGYTCTDLDDCDPDPCDTDLADPVICRAIGEPEPKGMYNCPTQIPTLSLGCEDIGANNYQCRTCSGFDPTTLEDVDECSDSQDECSASAICTNNIGSYECECLQGYYDPCVCDDTSKKIGADGKCPTCKIFGTDETCKPGRNCIKCTDCKEGPDPVGQPYACPNDEYLPEGRWYFPVDPQFRGEKPLSPGRTTGRGFEKKQGSTCVHTDIECVNVNECLNERSSIVTAEGKGCAGEEQADCVDECGTAQCICKGLDTKCLNEDDCWYGDGETCLRCTVCAVNECEAFAPTSTTDRVCKPLIVDGPYAVETTSGHTAQCLVMWGEEQKVFPERYNWGGKDSRANGGIDGMDVSDLCENPICGVCDYNGKTAVENIISGAEAVWTFKHLEGEDYLIMSAQGQEGYQCLGFRAPGAPYPELLSWESRSIADATGTCEIGICEGTTTSCWGDDMCATGTTCLFATCTNAAACGAVGTCPDDATTTCIVGDTVRPCSGTACVADAGHEADKKCGGLTSGAVCTSDSDCTAEFCMNVLCTDTSVDGCTATYGACNKGSTTMGMWTNEKPKDASSDWRSYTCGMSSLAQLKASPAVLWNLKPLGQRSSTSELACHADKKCSEAKYEGLFVFQTKARNGADYECLHFEDEGLNMYTHPTRIERGGANFEYSSPTTLCGIVTEDGMTDEEQLVKNKDAVFKLIPLV